MSAGSNPLARPPGERAPWALFKAELEALGFRPTKTLGQNFLVDPHYVARIVDASAPTSIAPTAIIRRFMDAPRLDFPGISLAHRWPLRHGS